MTSTALEYIQSRIQLAENGCWLWTRSLDHNGYGRARRARGTPDMQAHRFAYLTLVGSIPEGMTIDHLCHTRDTSCSAGGSCPHRRCVNPEHLEPVTQRENVARGRHPIAKVIGSGRCINGHELTEANTYTRPNGSKVCRTCQRKAKFRYHARLRSLPAEPVDYTTREMPVLVGVGDRTHPEIAAEKRQEDV